MVATKEQRIARRWMPPGSTVHPLPDVDAVVYTYPLKKGTGIAALAYRGSAGKPDWNYSFRSTGELQTYVENWWSNLLEHQRARTERLAQNLGKTCPWKVGQVLSCSWGYDQTNVDYYEVIAIRGKVVDIQEIGQHAIDRQGPCGDTVIPFRGYRGKVLKRKKPQTYDGGKTWFLRMTSYSFAWPWDGKPDHQTDPSFGH